MTRQLTDFLDGWMAFTDRSEPPKMYHLWCAVSMIAACLQRKCYVEWGTITFYPNMYVVLVGPSGKTRKGTAMGPALTLLEDLGIKLAAEAITREALIRELKNANANDPSLDTGTMSFHSSLTVFAPELTVFLGYHNNQLLSDLTDWYDCRNKWTYRTKNVGTDEIIGVYVNILGATTPDLIRTTMPLDAIGGGLTSRMIFVYEQEKYKTEPAPFLTSAELGLRDQLRADLERIYMMSGRFKVAEEFMDLWAPWYVEQDKNPPFNDPRFDGYMARRPNHVMKLSMIVNASRTDDMLLRKSDLEKAIDILVQTEVNMLDTFSGVGKYSHADTLTQVMNEIGMRGDRGITMQELQWMFRSDANKHIMSEIVETLQASGYLDVITKGGEQILRYKGEQNEDTDGDD